MALGRKTRRSSKRDTTPGHAPRGSTPRGSNSVAAQQVGDASGQAGASVAAAAGAWGNAYGSQVAAEETPLPEGFTEEQLQAATAWATGQGGPSANVIRQLQATLGAPTTGRYDRATVIAVVTDQQAAGAAVTGRADAAYMGTKGLIFTEEVAPLEVDDALLQDVQTNSPDGFAVSFYADYEPKTGDAWEFVNQATRFAGSANALGLEGGSIARGVPTPITSPADLVEGIRQIHTSLLQRYEAGLTPWMQRVYAAVRSSGNDGLGPDWTKANDVGLFSHGLTDALNLNDDEYNYNEGLHLDSRGQSNIRSFVQGIQGSVTSDVDVQLFACSAGRGTDEDAAWLEHTQDRRMGQNSIAQALSTELGEDASVYAHTTAGHTTENYAARVFGAEAGGGEGGLHMFDRLYPETFIQSELTRIYPTRSDEQRQQQHHNLRERMWSHYRGSIGPGKQIPGGTEQTGHLMFRDPDAAAQLLHADWQSKNPPQ